MRRGNAAISVVNYLSHCWQLCRALRAPCDRRCQRLRCGMIRRRGTFLPAAGIVMAPGPRAAAAAIVLAAALAVLQWPVTEPAPLPVLLPLSRSAVLASPPANCDGPTRAPPSLMHRDAHIAATHGDVQTIAKLLKSSKLVRWPICDPGARATAVAARQLRGRGRTDGSACMFERPTQQLAAAMAGQPRHAARPSRGARAAAGVTPRL